MSDAYVNALCMIDACMSDAYVNEVCMRDTCLR